MHANDFSRCLQKASLGWASVEVSRQYFPHIFCPTVMPLYGNEATIIKVKYEPPFVVSCLKYLPFCFG